MNFLNAAYLASEDGILVDYVKVDDDIAVKDSLYTVGRRGVAGTVLVHKIAGAIAEQGKSLQEVKEAAQKAARNVRSIGFAFSSCTVPAKGTPTFDIGEDEMEYGVGIHGEPGRKYSIAMIGYSGLNEAKTALKTELCVLDRDIEDIYYNIKVPLSAAKLLGNDNDNRINILNKLGTAVDMIDLRKGYFYIVVYIFNIPIKHT
jgi:dihydroxyacetone kinase